MSPAPAPYRLRTLGPLLLERSGVEEEAAVVQRGGKPLALLAYLVGEAGRPVSRALLADLLWGDEAPESARASLRQAIHALRRLLGDGAIGGERADVQLAGGVVEADHARFAALVAAGDIEGALAWYRGPFCDRLELRAAPRFERWMDAERERWRRLMLRAVEREVSARSAAADLAGAGRLARAARAADPGVTELDALCADAMIAEGDRDGARRLLEASRARLLAAGDDAAGLVEERLMRLDRAAMRQQSGRAVRPAAVELGQRFVGREEVLAKLFRQLADARAGRTARVLLVGPPGMGKSRVLDEFEARLTPRIARVARIRFLPAMRAIPGSALAEFARALCTLPGAMGVSERSAATLVQLLPELRLLFPAAPVLEIAASELARARVAAIADLIAAVAEDRLTVLLRDDEHNVDPESRVVLDGASLRSDLRLLDVRTSRVRLPDASPDREEIVLPPLAPTEVQALFASIGILTDEPWVEQALERLTLRSAGIPQLIMQRVRALGDRGALRVAGDRWRVEDPSGFVIAASDEDELAETVGGLHPSARLALTLLAQWRRPLRELDALALLGTFDPTRPRGEWRSAFAELEMRGLVTLRDDGWTVAHDTIAESSLAAQSTAEAEQVKSLFIGYWSEPGRMTVPVLEHLALLCGARNMRHAAVALVRAASRDRRLRDFGLRGRALAGRVATASGHPEWEKELYAAIGWYRRRSRGTVMAIGALTGIAAAGLFWLGGMIRPRVVVESEPMADAAGLDGTGSTATFVIQPRVGIYDGFGRRLARYAGTVRVRGRNRTLAGDTLVTLSDGRAQFERLAITGIAAGAPPDSSEAELEFLVGGIVRGARVRVRGGRLERRDQFRVVRASVNGIPMDSTLRVRVPVNDTLRFAVTFEYSSTATTANYVVGAAPLWMPREDATIRLAGLPRPAHDAWQSVYFSVPPARTPGRSHLVILMGMDDSVEHLFSLTQWTVGAPRWHDGNDVHDIGPEGIRSLRETGEAVLEQLQSEYQGRQSEVRVGGRMLPRPPVAGVRTGPRPMLGTAIEVEFFAP